MQTHLRKTSTPITQHGYSMVEVLVALVVLSVGLLGIAGLYVITLKSGSSAIFRMQAVNLASDMAERIRANRGAIDSYEGAAATAVGCGSSACDPSVMAAQDLFFWQGQISQALPGTTSGAISVSGSGTDPRDVQIQVKWTEPGGTTDMLEILNIQVNPIS